MITAMILLICALQSEPIHSKAKTSVVTGLSFCQLFILMIASKTYRLFYTHMYLSIFLKCLYRACGHFHFTVSTLPRLSFKLQNSPGGGFELGIGKNSLSWQLDDCVFVTRISHPRNTCEVEVFFGKGAPSKARELRQRRNHPFLRGPADSAGHCL